MNSEIVIGGFTLAAVLTALQGVIYQAFAIPDKLKPAISGILGVAMGLVAMWGTQTYPYSPAVILAFTVGGFMTAAASSGIYSWIKPRNGDVRKIVPIVLLLIMFGTMSGCATLGKLDVKADKDFYQGFKAAAMQKAASWPIKAGCFDGWGGFNPAPAPTAQDPMILRSLDELKKLLSTQSVSVEMAAIKEKFGDKWSLEDYNLGYIYCAQLKVGMQTGISTAQDTIPIIIKIIGMFQ
jgi:hypothetical protein